MADKSQKALAKFMRRNVEELTLRERELLRLVASMSTNLDELKNRQMQCENDHTNTMRAEEGEPKNFEEVELSDSEKISSKKEETESLGSNEEEPGAEKNKMADNSPTESFHEKDTK